MAAEVRMDQITYLMKKSICNQLRHYNVPPNHRLVCSSISQHHFHPVNGHDFHKELGNNKLTHSQNTSKLI